MNESANGASKSDAPSIHPKFKNVLVLAGGGAKGAYQFGCLQAFKKHGLKFDAVIGTSVGALNALLWSTDSMAEGEQLWGNLSFETVYPLRFLRTRGIPPMFKRIAGGLFIAARLIWANLNRWPLPSRSLERLLDFLLGLVVLFWVGGFAMGAWKERHHVLAVLIGIVWIFWASRVGKERNARGNYFIALWLSPPISLLLAVYLAAAGTVSVLRIAGLIGSIVFVVTVGIWILHKFNRALDGLTLFERRPLTRQLQRILTNRTISVRTWVTVAESRKIWDPKDGFFTPGATSPSGACFGEREPCVKQQWIPEYLPIHRASLEQAVNLCLASAALPFGFVEPVEFGKRRYHDGGVADNVPARPMFEHAYRLFVILLERPKCSHGASAIENLLDKSDISVNAWREWAYTQDIAALPIPNSWFGPKVPELTPPPPIRQPARLPQVVMFYPKSKLKKGSWGFVKGTLNFAPSFAREAMAIGFAETDELLTRGDGIANQTVQLFR